MASLLACGVITGVGAVVNTAALRPGQDAVVIGAGGVGLNAIQGARIAGARRIVAVDLLPDKLEIARQFGATHGVLASGAAPWDEVKDILGRGADAVFVTVGAIQAFDSALKYLVHGGRVVVVGMPPVGAVSSYEPVDFTYNAQNITGSNMGDTVIRRDIPWLVDLYLQGRAEARRADLAPLGPVEINEAIADTKSGAAKRNVLVF